MKSKNFLRFSGIFILFFLLKLTLNSFLLAENGDTYDFFKIANSIQNNNWLYESKRMPFLPLLLVIFPSDYFVWVGRLWINLFYFASIFVFFKILSIYIKSPPSPQTSSPRFVGEAGKLANQLAFFGTIIFATNIIIFENSFYILADTIFLLFNLLYIYSILAKKNSPFLLAFITIFAFYTRPEGFILGIVTVIYYLSEKKYKNILFYISTVTVLLIPNFTRNYILTKNIFSSGYFNDAAGFIFNNETILKRLSNFFFLTGGIFILPLSIILVKFDVKKIKNIFVNPLFLIFTLNSIVLFLWGPYPRLYSVPAAILIIFLMTIIAKIPHKNKKRILMASVFFTILTIFYIFVSQNLNHIDFGYKKYSKFASIVMSFAIIFIPIVYVKLKIPHKKFIFIISSLIVLLNLIVFFDKFRYTRYKYYSIKNCIQAYVNLNSKEKLAYASLSGLEEWYLRDEKKQYQYLGSIRSFDNWRTQNNVNYIITTFESGHKDNLGHIELSKYPNHKTICETSTPFFTGSTKLIKLN